MTVNEIMLELQSLGSENIKKILLKHGVKEPFFGVKIEYLKPIQKRIKKDYNLAKELYVTGNADAMYLAGLIADDEKMTKTDLQNWVVNALSPNISEYTVPWVTTGSRHGFELALEWIDSDREYIAAAGWATLSGLVSVLPDERLDINLLRALMERVAKTIHQAPNRVRYQMNNFLIATGCYVTDLTGEIEKLVPKIGTVTVDMGDTSCKVPDALDYISRMKNKNTLGKKKKTVKC